MVETFKVWQCVGCGRIDHPQPCVGICQDRKVEMVYAADHAQSVAALEAILRRIAFTTPRPGEWEPAWRALQADARRALEAGRRLT
jgi:hypothetical protein